MSGMPPAVERALFGCFRMPSVQTMMSRKTSITNAFVNAIIPVVKPTAAEIYEALEILGMSPETIACAYCGDKCSEWDHLRPLVVNRRPTGFISEIGNLVPSCGKCNQSKGNSRWDVWMVGKARHAPAQRGVPDLQRRIERLHAYERWRPPTPVAFESILGPDLYSEYWARLDRAMAFMRECQEFADGLRLRVAAAHSK